MGFASSIKEINKSINCWDCGKQHIVTFKLDDSKKQITCDRCGSIYTVFNPVTRKKLK